MKILYAIQGTGNGHVARAREILPLLDRLGKVSTVVSGISTEVSIGRPVDFRYHGLGFVVGKQGGVSIAETAKSLKLGQFYQDTHTLPVTDFDWVITDFEPVTAWACQWQKKPCTGLSHQFGTIHPLAPKTEKKDWFGRLVLHNYAPAFQQFGFHFMALGDRVFTPVIRSEIRLLVPENLGHYTVYLPAYSDELLLNYLSQVNTQWQVFSKHSKRAYIKGNVAIHPVNNEAFVESLRTSEGLFCGAGFESPAEALFLGKKVLAIPMQGQYEQYLNAAGLVSVGGRSIPKLEQSTIQLVTNWVNDKTQLQLDYPDQTWAIIQLAWAHYQGDTKAVLGDFL